MRFKRYNKIKLSKKKIYPMKLKVKIKIMNKLSLIKNQNKLWNHWKNHKKMNILRNQKLNKRAYRNKAA
jgi:hypothetical protein